MNMAESKLSEARRRAIQKYHDKFVQVKFYCEPDFYAEIKEYCESRGESVAQLIKRSVREQMIRDTAP